MNLNQIKANAPVGATHYEIVDGVAYYHKPGYFWLVDRWIEELCWFDINDIEPLP